MCVCVCVQSHERGDGRGAAVDPKLPVALRRGPRTDGRQRRHHGDPGAAGTGRLRTPQRRRHPDLDPLPPARPRRGRRGLKSERD